MRRTNFPSSKSISSFIRCCSASYTALSGLLDDETGALTGTLCTEAALSLAAGPVPLAAGLVFGADMAIKAKEENVRS